MPPSCSAPLCFGAAFPTGRFPTGGRRWTPSRRSCGKQAPTWSTPIPPATPTRTVADDVDAAGLVEAKADLVRAHVSQVLKNGLVDLDALEALARYRGFQARLRQAEGFETDRFVWDLASRPAASIPSDLTELSLVTEGVA